MAFNTFSVYLCARFAVLMLNLLALTYLLSLPGYHAATVSLVLLFVAQVIEVLRFISRTNAELVRFLDAARYADFSQRFELQQLGSGFGELGNAFSDILKRLQAVRTGQEEELRHLKAIVEHVPVPLLSIHHDKQLSQWNNSARRLFGAYQVSRTSDLSQFGDDFAKQLGTIKPGERKLVIFSVDGMEQQLALAATQIRLSGKHELLVSMQDIQSELDGVQLQAWQDLVRVLTHEIMNSITPVASLAKTAIDLVEDAKARITHDGIHNPALMDALNDVSDAVTTVARRSDGLTHFVGSYRRLSHLPPPNKKIIKLGQLFNQVTALATQDWPQKGIRFTTQVDPDELDVNVDVGMLEQVLINLLHNAEHAVQNSAAPEIRMKAYLNPRGHAVIEVSDNGEGITSDIAEKIFVPFFTTKREGSGVGLALTRQVMIAHGGSVKMLPGALGGAQFNLTF